MSPINHKLVERGAKALFRRRCPGAKWSGWLGGTTIKQCLADSRTVLKAILRKS
jgi:hypothetical protein